ncbi:MAG: YcaO-like family protein [Acidovorax sp.]|uniref:YcaO-like family protein n=1 Tax=Acidovorax sp. TaxID=1872122 RepID=UPI0039E5C175
MQALSQLLLARAAQARCGLLLAPQRSAAQASDVAGLANWAVPPDPAEAWQTVSGAVGWSHADARAAAIAEGLERLAAAQVPLPLRSRADLAQAGERVVDEDGFALFSPAQRQSPGFAWPMPPSPQDWFAPVHPLLPGLPPGTAPVWVPQELVGLGPRRGAARLPSTSSGLAAHADGAHGPWLALLRAAQELLERDALTVTWLHGLGGREIAVPAHWQARAARLGGVLRAFDITQAWNPHPVIAVLGGAPWQGQPRWVLGMACRATAAAALEKAALEWAQSLAFAGYMLGERAQALPREPAQLRRFDEHAAFYSLRPDLWAQIPLLRHARPAEEKHGGGQDMPDERALALAQLNHLLERLRGAGIDLLYRELTTRDVAATGLRVMRVLSPQLAQLHADESAPFLGGRTVDWRWRYPWAQPHGPFPNPLPHPLG